MTIMTDAYSLEDQAPTSVVQRLCWTCARLFSVAGASDLRTICPACQKRKAEGLPPISTCRHKDQIVPISRLADPTVQALMVPEDRKAMRLQESPTPIDPKVQALMVPEDHQLVLTRMDWMFMRSLVPRAVDLGTACVDFNRCVIIRDGEMIKVTHQEIRFLALLCHEVGAVVPFLILESQVTHIISRRSLDTMKAALGKKLGFKIGIIPKIGLFIPELRKGAANHSRSSCR